MALIGQGAPVQAYEYQLPTPMGAVGTSIPTIGQQFMNMEEGERFANVQMWINGVEVEPTIDYETEAVYYIPENPLPPGEYKVRLVVEITHPQADQGWFYDPLDSVFDFQVTEDAVPPAAPSPETQQAIELINQLRRRAGVGSVQYDASLQAAAERHAVWMDTNEIYQHEESPGSPLFLGVTPLDRAQYFGFSGNGTAEDIHEISDVQAAIMDWMTGPYHRMPILSPFTRSVGFGSSGDYAVLEMGTGKSSDQIVVWPYDGQQDVPVSWEALEVPNPLSLYPSIVPPVGSVISLQFGSLLEDLKLTEASLTTADGTAVPVLKFSMENDPNLVDGAFLIPASPLKEGTTYYVSMKGTLTDHKGTRPFSKTWSFRTAGSEPAAPAPVTGPVQLRDIQDHWAKEQIERLVNLGIVSGHPDGTFRPDDALERGAFVKMLVSALKLPLSPGDLGGFQDVAGHWTVEAGYLGSAVAAGIVQPGDYPGGRFNPNGPISRDEIAAMITRAAKVIVEPVERPSGPVPIGAQIFTDASEWQHPAQIMAAIESGLMTGYKEADGSYTFRPESEATRAEASVLIIRLLDRAGL